MIPIPAIDLKGGKVVRLLQGKFEEEKVYFDRPEAVAKGFEGSGAQRLHVVDLDGALHGKPKNQALIEAILGSVKVPIEVGGGIRDLKTVERYLGLGISWAVVGTRACLDKGFLKEAVAEFREKVIFGIDAKNGFVATDGWTNVTKTRAVDLIQEIQAANGKTIIYTDIAKDGALQGPNLEEVQTVSRSTTLEVIASGGIGSLGDLQNILDLKQSNIVGTIIGKALYENKLTLADAVKLCQDSRV